MTGGLRCPDCGRFSASPWQSKWEYWSWGGICKVHGEWTDGE